MPQLLPGFSILFGMILAIYTLASAIRTFVLPRGDNVPLTRLTFSCVDLPFALLRRTIHTYEARDRVMAMYAPLALLMTPIVWVVLIIIAYAFIYWGAGVQPWEKALEMSGSSLLTLGTVPFPNLPVTLIIFTQATIGLGIVALLLAYLPTIYSAFSRREALVSMLEVRAGVPPSAVTMVQRLYRINAFEDRATLNNLWKEWEVWFTELEESHTSLAALVHLRSPQPHRSWITAAGTVLDAAAIITSTVKDCNHPQANLTLRAGYIALRGIARFFDIAYNPDPAPDDPISVSRYEFDEVYDELLETGVPLNPDRDQCWKDFAGWRVNYDLVLLRLAALTMAPYAPWISDRSRPASTLTMLERAKVKWRRSLFR